MPSAGCAQPLRAICTYAGQCIWPVRTMAIPSTYCAQARDICITAEYCTQAVKSLCTVHSLRSVFTCIPGSNRHVHSLSMLCTTSEWCAQDMRGICKSSAQCAQLPWAICITLGQCDQAVESLCTAPELCSQEAKAYAHFQHGVHTHMHMI